MATFGSVTSNTALVGETRLNIVNFRKGGTAPADSTLGTTPTVPTLLFSATNQLISGNLPLPPDMDVTVNPTLVLMCALDVAETNLDTLDWTCDYLVTEPASGDAGLLKTSTQITGLVTVTTAGGLVQGNVYEVPLTFAVGDATNPIDATKDDIGFEIHLTNTTGVGAAHVFAGRFSYERAD